MLDKFREAKQLEIDSLHKDFIEGRLPAVYQGNRPSFVEAIRAKGPGAVIAEFKPASPSKGVLKENLNPLDYADGDTPRTGLRPSPCSPSTSTSRAPRTSCS